MNRICEKIIDKKRKEMLVQEIENMRLDPLLYYSFRRTRLRRALSIKETECEMEDLRVRKEAETNMVVETGLVPFLRISFY